MCIYFVNCYEWNWIWTHTSFFLLHPWGWVYTDCLLKNKFEGVMLELIMWFYWPFHNGDFFQTQFSWFWCSFMQRFVYTMRAVQGSLMVSSIINIFLGFSRAWGNLTRYCISSISCSFSWTIPWIIMSSGLKLRSTMFILVLFSNYSLIVLSRFFSPVVLVPVVCVVGLGLFMRGFPEVVTFVLENSELWMRPQI